MNQLKRRDPMADPMLDAQQPRMPTVSGSKRKGAPPPQAPPMLSVPPPAQFGPFQPLPSTPPAQLASPQGEGAYEDQLAQLLAALKGVSSLG